jgi:hypothetical protein
VSRWSPAGAPSPTPGAGARPGGACCHHYVVHRYFYGAVCPQNHPSRVLLLWECVARYMCHPDGVLIFFSYVLTPGFVSRWSPAGALSPTPGAGARHAVACCHHYVVHRYFYGVVCPQNHPSRVLLLCECVARYMCHPGGVLMFFTCDPGFCVSVVACRRPLAHTRGWRPPRCGVLSPLRGSPLFLWCCVPPKPPFQGAFVVGMCRQVYVSP